MSVLRHHSPAFNRAARMVSLILEMELSVRVYSSVTPPLYSIGESYVAEPEKCTSETPVVEIISFMLPALKIGRASCRERVFV